MWTPARLPSRVAIALRLTVAALAVPHVGLAQAHPIRGQGTVASPWLLPDDPDVLPAARLVWKVQTAGSPTVATQVPGLALVLDDVGQQHRLRALEIATGKVRWTALTQDADLARVTTDAVVLAEGDRWVAHEPQSGKILWKTAMLGTMTAWRDRLLVTRELEHGPIPKYPLELREARTGKVLLKLPDLKVLNVTDDAPWLMVRCGMHDCKVLDRDGKFQTVSEQEYASGTVHLEAEARAVTAKSAGDLLLAAVPVAGIKACVVQRNRLLLAGSEGALVTEPPRLDPELANELDLAADEAETPQRRRYRAEAVDKPHCLRTEGAAALVQVVPGLGPVAWLFDAAGGAPPRVVVVPGKEAGSLRAVEAGMVLWDDDRGLSAFALQDPWLPARRPAVPLLRDAEVWLEAVAGRRPPSQSGDCRDDAPSAEGAAARLDRLPTQAFAPVLFRKLASASREDLTAFLPWACPQPDRPAPAELVGAWALRWEVLGRSLAPDGWRNHAQIGARCLSTAGRPQWWKPMLERVQRQPWSAAWLKARTAAVDAIDEVVPDAIATAWLRGVVAAYGRAIPKDRRGGALAQEWGPLLAATARFTAGAPGAPAEWAKLDASLGQRGPAAVCARRDLKSSNSAVDGACVLEPGLDAWQAGDSGWAVMESPAVGSERLDLWIFHWQNEQWQGPWLADAAPWFAKRDWRLPVGPDRWTSLEVAAEDDGRQLIWQRLASEKPCDPNEEPADLEQTWLPAALTWSAVAVDSDGDGWTDVLERRLGTDLLKADSDGDGVVDALDPAPMCPRRPIQGPRDAVLAAVLRARTAPLPLRLEWNRPCFDAPTLGGPLLPARSDDGPVLRIEARAEPGPGVWTAWLETAHRRLRLRVLVEPLRDGRWNAHLLDVTDTAEALSLLWANREDRP